MKKAFIVLWVLLLWFLAVAGRFIRSGGRDVPPPDVADFQAEKRPDVRPEDNAYDHFLAAAKQVVNPDDFPAVAGFLAGKPAELTEIRECLAKNEACLARLRQGTECAIYQALARDPEMKDEPFSSWISMAKAATLAVRLAQVEGRYPEAVSGTALELRFGSLVQNDAEGLLPYLVGISILNSGLERAQELARDPALPAELQRQLAGLLAALPAPNAGLERALRWEYRFGEWAVERVMEDVLMRGGQRLRPQALRNYFMKRARRSNRFFQPNRTRQELADFYRGMIRNVPKSRADMVFPEVREWEPSIRDFLRPNVGGRMFMVILEPSMSRMFDNMCYACGELAGVQLVLACRRFRQDRGPWPETLAELVPEYLAAVPADPFDGRPFRYSAEKAIVWSVGKNLTDENGSTGLLDDNCKRKGGLANFHAEDMVFELQPARAEE